MSINLNVPRKAKSITHNYQLIKVKLENKNLPDLKNKQEITSDNLKEEQSEELNRDV